MPDSDIKNSHPLAPGSTIGIMGGGQLGRMTALAAGQLGYKCHIFCPDEDSPASQVSAQTTVAAYDDIDALKSFAEQVDVVTFEFENIPHESVQLLAEHAVVRPGWKSLATAQDRLVEKEFINTIAPTTPFRRVTSPAELEAAADEIGRPAVLKTARMGYDGKGQVRLSENDDLEAGFASLNTNDAILEEMVRFQAEVSFLVARAASPALKFAACQIRAKPLSNSTLSSSGSQKTTSRKNSRVAVFSNRRIGN